MESTEKIDGRRRDPNKEPTTPLQINVPASFRAALLAQSRAEGLTMTEYVIHDVGKTLRRKGAWAGEHDGSS